MSDSLSNLHNSNGVNLKDKRTQGMAFTLVLITLKEHVHEHEQS